MVDSLSLWVIISIAVLLVGLVVAWIASHIAGRYEVRRLNSQHTVIAEYTAPTTLTPAELGYMFDATFGKNELLATIACLFTKKAIRLTPSGSDDFMITPLDAFSGQLDNSEASLLGYLRMDSVEQLRWSELSSKVSAEAGTQDDFESEVTRSLINKGLLNEHTITSMLFKSRVVSYIFGFTSALGIFIFSSHWSNKTINAAQTNDGFKSLERGISHFTLAILCIAAAAIVYLYINLLVFIYMRRGDIPLAATSQLHEIWPEIAGYRLFLQETEYVRLQTNPEATDPSMAYCLALGLDPGFIRSLSQIS